MREVSMSRYEKSMATATGHIPLAIHQIPFKPIPIPDYASSPAILLKPTSQHP